MTGPVSEFLSHYDSDVSDRYSALLFVPWTVKPVFGYLSDKISFFKYRVKGFVVLVSFLNVGCAALGIYLFEHYKSRLHIAVVFGLFFTVYTLFAMTDSICQGMTSITVKLEQRLSTIKREVETRSDFDHYSSNYVNYVIVRKIARSLFSLYSVSFRYNEARGDKFEGLSRLMWVLLFASSYFIVHPFLFFDELRV